MLDETETWSSSARDLFDPSVVHLDQWTDGYKAKLAGVADDIASLRHDHESSWIDIIEKGANALLIAFFGKISEQERTDAKCEVTLAPFRQTVGSGLIVMLGQVGTPLALPSCFRLPLTRWATWNNLFIQVFDGYG